jgi:hypothetical protein
MKFESKAHMAQELMSGKCFKLGDKGVVYYDEKSTRPFRFEKSDIGNLWNLYNQDVWTEIGTEHVHQDLIDSYQEGQAWQYKGATKNTSFWSDSIDDDGDWCEPSWLSSVQYRLHPHNDLIQAFNKGAKIEYLAKNGWAETTHPTWNEDTQYRIKPVTKIVYEWMFKSKYADNWKIESLLFSEEEAKEHFKEHTYCKTGREFEVEV